MNAFASVSRVEFYRDGTKIGEDTSAPYTFSVDTTGVPNGSHSFSAKAYDTAGNVTTSSISTVTVNNNIIDSGSWAKLLGGSNQDVGYAVASDVQGNIYIAGFFLGTAYFDPTTFLTSKGSSDIYVAKYQPGGNLLWVKLFGGTDEELAYGIALYQNEVIVTGYFKGAAAFGSAYNFTSAGDRDIFLLKLSQQTGDVNFAKKIGGTNSDYAKSVAIDPRNGDIVIGGQFAGAVDFGSGSRFYSTLGSQDSFIARYSLAGNFQWVKNFKCGSSDMATSMAVDSQGNVYATGYFQGNMSAGTINDILYTKGDEDIYVVKLSPSGGHMWSKGFGNTRTDAGSSIIVDNNDNVALTGVFTTSIDFGKGALLGYTLDIFVAKLSGIDGSEIWARSFDYTSSIQEANSVAADSSGNIFVTGYFDYTRNFGGGVWKSLGGHDGFIVKLSSASGAFGGGTRFGGTGSDVGYAVAVSPDGKAIVTGSTNGGDFNGTTLVSAGGSSDIFLMKMDA